MRVFFTGGGTGGHLYPALAIARALVLRRPDVRPHFIGARRGIERDILPATEFTHTLLDLHPLYRSAPWSNWRTVAGLARGWRAVAALAREEPARLAVATGGYAASATLAWAAAARVPYTLQEQNAFAGRTTWLFSRWAREIHLGFPEAASHLPSSARGRAVDTGNPIELPIPVAQRPARAVARQAAGLAAEVRFVVLAFGGSQGSAALNRLVDDWVAAGLPDGVGVIWGTGRAHYARHAHRAGAQVAVQPYLSPIAGAYAAADVAVTRAGAMTTAELCGWGLPMFLVPLPTAASDHQAANARALAAAGAAEWVPEREASAAHIDAFARGLMHDRERLAARGAAALARARPNAAADVAARLDALLSGASLPLPGAA